MDNSWRNFKNQLETRPEPEFDPSDWAAVEKQLHPSSNKQNSRIVVTSWLVGGLLLCLFSSLVGNCWQWSKLQKLASQSLVTIHQDTLFQTKVIYHTDTLIVSQIRYRRDTIFLNDHLLASNKPELTSLSTVSKNVENATSGSSNTISQRAVFVESEKESTPLSLPNATPQSFTPTFLPFHPILLAHNPPPFSLNQNPILVSPDNYLSFEQKWLQFTQKIQPTSVKLGLTAQASYPINPNLTRQIEYGYGVEGQLDFGKHVRLWLNGAYGNLYYETTEMGDHVGIPLLSPPSNDFSLEKASVLRPYWQYSSGVLYRFRPSQKWQPSIGLGFQVTRSTNSTIDYLFSNHTGTNWEQEVQIGSSNEPHHFGVLRAGVEHAFHRDWIWYLSANYQYNLDNLEQATPSLFGIYSGIFYQF